MTKLSAALLSAFAFGRVESAWSKCSAVCGGGTQTDENGVIRNCNVEACSVWDANLLTSGDFDDLTAWDCHFCSINPLDDGYNGGGVTIGHRNQAFKSVKQEGPCTQYQSILGQNSVAKVFVRFPDNHGSFEVSPTMRVFGDNFETTFISWGTNVIPAVDGPDPEWYSIGGSQTFLSEDVDLSALTCRWYVSVKDKTTTFDVDRAYLVHARDIEEPMKQDLNGNIINSGFEIPSTDSLWDLSGWITSGQNTLETVTASDAPQGTTYLKVGNRVSPGTVDVGQFLTLPENFDANQLLEFRYWAKFSYDDAAVDAATIGEDRHNQWLGKMQIIHEPNEDGVEVTTQHQCHKACMIPDGKWRQYHATCNLALAIQDDPDVEKVGTVKSIRWSVTGPANGIDIYMDDVFVGVYERNRDWVPGANLRIEELRTLPVQFEITGAPPGVTLDIEMTHQPYPFGGKFGRDQYELYPPGGIQEEWKYYFNYGYCTNEMKWQATERVKGVRDYTRGMAIRELFDSWGIPLSGNTLLWEVPDKATPFWYRDELQAYRDAGQSAEPLSENILFHVEDTMRTFKGRNTNYKLINEPTHGDEFRTNYHDIWNRVLNKARETDPDAELIINDYDIARSDMGQCLLDLVNGYDIDYIGVQSHQHPGFNGRAVNERFDLLASNGHPLIITEFDTSHWDLHERALDTEDFLRMAYAHPRIDQIITWYYMYTDASAVNLKDQVIFENEINANSSAYLTANNGEPYPLYPNEAGMAWIQLIKKDWTSNEQITLTTGSQNIERNIFNGDFAFTIKDAQGNVRKQTNLTISNQNCHQSVAGSDIVVDGDFDNGILSSEWNVVDEYDFHWDGYMVDALRVKKMTTVELDVSGTMTDGEMYSSWFYAQLNTEVKGATLEGDKTIRAVDETGTTIAMGTFTAYNQYIRVAAMAPFTASATNSKLSITVEGYDGDVLLDHFFVLPTATMLGCQQKIQFDLSSKFTR